MRGHPVVAALRIPGSTHQSIPYDNIAGRALSPGSGDRARLNDQRGRNPTGPGLRSAKPTRPPSLRCQVYRRRVH